MQDIILAYMPILRIILTFLVSKLSLIGPHPPFSLPLYVRSCEFVDVRILKRMKGGFDGSDVAGDTDHANTGDGELEGLPPACTSLQLAPHFFKQRITLIN